jgi:cation transport ATPase
LIEHRAWILATLAVGALVAGGLAHLAGNGGLGDDIWRSAVVLLSVELAVEVVRTITVERHMGVDTIALVAMVGSLALGEELAGLIVGIMFTGGSTLEEIASSRARRELTALVQRPQARTAQARRTHTRGPCRASPGWRDTGGAHRRGDPRRWHRAQRGSSGGHERA